MSSRPRGSDSEGASGDEASAGAASKRRRGMPGALPSCCQLSEDAEASGQRSRAGSRSRSPSPQAGPSGSAVHAASCGFTSMSETAGRSGSRDRSRSPSPSDGGVAAGAGIRRDGDGNRC